MKKLITIEGMAASGKTKLAIEIKELLERKGENVLILDAGDTCSPKALRALKPSAIINIKSSSSKIY